MTKVKRTKKIQNYVMKNIRGLANTLMIELVLIDITIGTLSYFMILWL